MRFHLTLLTLFVIIAALTGQLLWGDALVWGTLDGDTIMWGTLGAEDGEYVVWGS